MRIFLGCLLLVLFCGAERPLPAADWPQWRGPDRSGHVPAGQPVPQTLPAEPKFLWRVKIADGVGSPVVADGRVFFLDAGDKEEIVHAVDAATGKELWQKPLFELHEDIQSKGPRSTPLVDQDRVYVQSAKGEFHCLNARTGQLIWRKNFVTDFGALFIGEKPNPLAVGATRHGNNGSPVTEGPHIFLAAGGTNGASVVCLDKLTGKLVWKSQNDQAGYGPLVIETVAGQRQIIAFTAEGVIGLDVKNGQLLWRFPIKTTWARHVTTPVVVEDVVMVASHQHGLFGIKISRQGAQWQANQAWLIKEAAINFASPVVVGHHLYGVGPAKDIICVDARTGKLAWAKTGLITSAAGKAHAGFLVMGANILFLTDSGQLFLMAADPQSYREISQLQVCGVNWCNPAYADGKLYVRDAKELLCVNLLP